MCTGRVCVWWLSFQRRAWVHSSPANDFFENKIRAILAINWYACHSSKLKTPTGGLVLDIRAGVLSGGKSRLVIVAGKPEAGSLVRALR